MFGTLAYVFAPQVNGYPTFGLRKFINYMFDNSIDEYQSSTCNS